MALPLGTDHTAGKSCPEVRFGGRRSSLGAHFQRNTDDGLVNQGLGWGSLETLGLGLPPGLAPQHREASQRGINRGSSSTGKAM